MTHKDSGDDGAARIHNDAGLGLSMGVRLLYTIAPKKELGLSHFMKSCLLIMKMGKET